MSSKSMSVLLLLLLLHRLRLMLSCKKMGGGDVEPVQGSPILECLGRTGNSMYGRVCVSSCAELRVLSRRGNGSEEDNV